MNYFLIAGEASGDLHGAALIRELSGNDPSAAFTFFGGDMMQAESGKAPLVHIREMAYMGFSEVLRHLADIRRNLRAAIRVLDAKKPDALILIDYPSFNLRVAREAAKRNIPVFYYIPPKVWAWKKWRTKTILRLCNKVFTIFPFEVDFYNSYAGGKYAGKNQLVYAGNPSVEEVRRQLAEASTHEDFLLKYRFRPNRPLVALMPGSRKGEIRANLPVMLEAMDRFTQYKALIIGAPGIEDKFYSSFLAGREVPVVREKSTPAVLAHCRGALATSGTATLELALCSVPQVAMYRSNGSKLAYKLMSKVLSVPFVTLPNLIAGREVIPELLLHECTSDNVSGKLSCLLRPDAPDRLAQLEGYKEIAMRLTDKNAPATAAKEIVEALSAK